MFFQKEPEKKLKYENLSIEIQRMWNMKCVVMPVITGATGIVTKGLKLSGNNIRIAFNRFSTKDSCTRNIAHYKETSSLNVFDDGAVLLLFKFWTFSIVSLF
jgi:hypothetical protein